ncbi:MAG: cobalamin-dependent protein, partial [Planctomycetes bacterium]|nr:cobalamin-dependent protein [Planctomycetota bacterium]
LGQDTLSEEFKDLMATTEVRLRFLAESLFVERPAIFEDHLVWTRSALATRDGDPSVTEANLESMAQELMGWLPEGCGAMAESYVRRGLEAFRAAPAGASTHLPEELPFLDEARGYLVAVLEARTDDALEIVDRLLDAGHPLDAILSSIIIPVQREIGRMWQIGDATVADEHLLTRTTERVIRALENRKRTDRNGRRVLFAAAEGDMHELGQQIAALYFAEAGWNPVVFGASMPIESVLQAITDYAPRLIAVSIQIGLHVRGAAALVARIRESNDIPILIGGRMLEVVPDLWEVLGADGGSCDAAGSVRKASELVPL